MVYDNTPALLAADAWQVNGGNQAALARYYGTQRYLVSWAVQIKKRADAATVALVREGLMGINQAYRQKVLGYRN